MSQPTIDLQKARDAEQMMDSALQNLESYLQADLEPYERESLAHLVQAEEWEELNDRFFQKLSFGTGGLRGRTIGRVVTPVEQGAGGANGRPEFPASGTSTMNLLNLRRAMRGLVQVLGEETEGRPAVVIGHDSRHFSREFAEACAEVAVEGGCDAYLFDGPRSTPEVSFAIRQLKATGGVVLTASHNPYYDNGFKAYGPDGAQLLSAMAQRVIEAVETQAGETGGEEASERGQLQVLGAAMDEAYREKLRTVLLQPELLAQAADLKIIYTNLHGTGGVIIEPLLRESGFAVLTVPEQDGFNGAFPTVKSPNPENGPALQMGVELALAEGGEVVVGTDPDCDRMGVAVRNGQGEMELLTGNQIGALLAWYRIHTMFEKGWVTESNRSRAVLIKTLVTSEWQRAIAESFGIQVVNTLTGFKYIAEKLSKYESSIPAEKKGDYRQLSEEESRRLRLEYSRFLVFGGEESYGYLASDFVRDKDGNASALMFGELAAYARSQGKTIPQLRDELWQQYGVYLERGESLVMEGAEGAAQIAALATSYREQPLQEVDGSAVRESVDYSQGGHFDEEGDELPPTAMMIVTLEDGRRFAVRPSGTEPKIKYYLFGHAQPQDNVAAGRVEVEQSLASLWEALQVDARQRLIQE